MVTTRKMGCLPAAVLAILWMGCSSTGGPGDGGDGDAGDCPGRGQLQLNVLGSPNIKTQPGQDVELKAVLVERCVGPAAGQQVSFSISGSSGGSTLESESATTSDAGLAAVVLHAGAQQALFSVHASHPQDPEGVYFSVEVKPVAIGLYAVGPTTLQLYCNEDLDLEVVLQEIESARPVRSVEISFSIVPPPPGNATLSPAAAKTNLSGRARTGFHSGATSTTYQVLCQGAAQDVGTVTFDIQVVSRQACATSDDCPPNFACVSGECRESGGGGCVTDDDCPQGFVCLQAECRPEGSLPGTCESAADCPQGYYCEGHQCFPCDDSGAHPECGPGIECREDEDCPMDFVCVDGHCHSACNPLDCGDLDAECGQVLDGCGTVLDCGICDEPDTCGGGGFPNRCGCTPRCAGRQCGPDGCDSDCGDCDSGFECNEAVGLCEAECVPRDCDELGKDCGDVPDGCGGTNHCGSCSSPDTCGGGGVPNVCGCTRQCLGRECGPDGCDGECGTCPDEAECNAAGRCVPMVPDMDGCWYLEHYFDLEGALPQFLQGLAGPMDQLDRWLNECDFTGIGFIDDFLCDLVDEYVPDWVGDVVHVLNNIYWILKEMRVGGELNLVHLNPPELLSATESWDTIRLLYPDACCEGDPGPCNPHQDPEFPDCATIDIAGGEELEAGEVGLIVEPYTARIDINPGPPIGYTFRVTERRVQIEYSKFVGFVVDLLVEMVTGYDSLEEALMDVIDCQDIQDLLEDTFGSIVPDIRPQCQSMKRSLVNGIYAILDQIGVGWKLMKFGGSAALRVEDHPPWGVSLGREDHETSGDGSWDGTFNIVFEGPLTGNWFSDR